MATVVVGLGSNVGDRAHHLRVATAALARLDGVQLLACSPIYQSLALGPPQPNYLNAALRLRVARPLEDFFAACQRLEIALGRQRTVHWGPRCIDIDLLWASEQSLPSATDLVLPHPFLLQRAFALGPLLDVMPELSSCWSAVLNRLGGKPELWRAAELADILQDQATLQHSDER